MGPTISIILSLSVLTIFWLRIVRIVLKGTNF